MNGRATFGIVVARFGKLDKQVWCVRKTARKIHEVEEAMAGTRRTIMSRVKRINDLGRKGLRHRH